MSQAEFAQAAGVSRSTQISYEHGDTEPTTAYLRAAESLGVNIGQLMYGVDVFGAQDVSPKPPNWMLIQQCSETVEFFCIRFAPTCPARFRWEMISQLYLALNSQDSSKEDEGTLPSPLKLLETIWADYAK